MSDDRAIAGTPSEPGTGAGPSRGGIVDGHVHLFTLPLVQEWARGAQVPERVRQAAKNGSWNRRGKQRRLPDLGPEDAARWYADRLDDAGVAQAVVMSVVPDSQYMRDFVAAGAGRLFACANIDPRLPDAPERLEAELAAGFRGVKLLPVNRRYRLSAPECRPFFEKAQELAATIVIHYGVTVDPHGDLRYADPVDLSPVARDHPDVQFVIAHFGAGYLEQVLRLAYQCKNVHVDTSGTNNWLDFQAAFRSLRDVFERTLAALGPERIVFGTDANTTGPYRDWIKNQQVGLLDEIGLSAAEKELILRANAVRLFRLDRDD